MQKRPGLQGEVVAPGRSGVARLRVQQAAFHSDERLDLCAAANIYFCSQQAPLFIDNYSYFSFQNASVRDYRSRNNAGMAKPFE